MTNWHQNKKNQVSAPLFVNPTAGSLTKEMKEVCRRFEQVTGMRVVVQEKAGKANKYLAKSEPLEMEKYGRDEYFLCRTGNENVKRMELDMKLFCQTCLRDGRTTTSEGESGRNGFTRGAEHLSALRLEDENSPLWKHCQIKHNGMKAEFTMKVC